MPKTWQRARQPEQKEQRRADIVAAAATLFDEEGFDGVGLSAIARRAGLAKSNVYRYFDSREAIFLALLVQDYDAFVTAFEAGLAPLVGDDDVDAVAKVIASTAVAHPRLCALTAVLSSVIEQNLSFESFAEFKAQVAQVSLRISNALHSALPSLSHDAILAFQRYLQALVAGLWPMSCPPPMADELLARPEYQHFHTDFEADLRSAVAAILRGLR